MAARLSVASATVPGVDEGLYESLLTERLHRALAGRSDLRPEIDTVDDAEQPLAIARHLAPLIERAVRSAATPQERADLVHRILAALSDPDAMAEALHQREPPTIERLEEIVAANRLDVARLPRPATPLSDTALMTNARDEPSLAAELRAELASADQVDLLCAFVKWQGLRLLEDELAELRERNVTLRVITTTYLGATDARALDALVDEFGAQVRVNYEIDRTRLHAKAWLLRRNNGFHTAYVGSSNLSHVALVDGLEWNVRFSAVSTPQVLEQFRVTFDSYWEDRACESYEPAADGERLRAALENAAGGRE